MSPDESFDERSNLDEVLRRPTSRRAWFIRWGALALTVALSIGIVATLATPRMTTLHIAHVTYALYLTSNINWGTLTLTSGNRAIPLTSAPGLPPSVRLTSGDTPQHLMVSYAASPFTTKHCQLTIPPVHGDSCVGLNGEDPQTMGKAFATPSATPLDVDLSFTLNDLAPGRRGAILDLVDSQLQTALPPTLVAPGSHYAIGELLQKTVTIADVPLIANLRTTRATIAESACALICAPNDFTKLASGQQDVWRVLTNAQQTWHYTRGSDGMVVGDTFENLLAPITFDLVYDPAADAWRAPAFGQSLTTPTDAALHALCADGQHFIDELSFQSLLTQARFSADATSTDHGVNGCMLHVAALDQHSPGADFLWRLGAMYAVNDVARAIDARLPSATPQDLASFAG